MVRHSALGMIILAAVASAGCDQGSKDQPGTTATARATATAQAAAKGIDAPGNDPKVVELAKKALGCEWQKTGFKYDCADLKAWKESELLKEGKADETLVSMLEDDNERVRWLAAQALSSRGKAYRTDEKLAKRVLAAAQAEKNEAVASNLGSALGRINAEKTGLEAEIKKLIESHQLQQLRRSTVSAVLFSNRQFYEFHMALAKGEKNKDVRKAAISAFWTGTPSDKYDQTCAMWLDRVVNDEDDNIAGEAAYLCGFYSGGGGCQDQWDALLDAIEKRAKEGQVKSSQMAAALYYFHKQKKASAAQKQRALAIAKQIADNADNSGAARARALEFVAEKDPAGPTFVAKFKDDEDFFVKSRATQILKKKAETK